MELICKEEVFAIVGAAYEVHTELGAGFLEKVYQEALEYELKDRGIPFKPQERLRIRFKSRVLKRWYKIDFFCYAGVGVEIKAADRLTSKDESQLLNYLKASGLRVGVLLNFGRVQGLEWKRMVY